MRVAKNQEIWIHIILCATRLRNSFYNLCLPTLVLFWAGHLYIHFLPFLILHNISTQTRISRPHPMTSLYYSCNEATRYSALVYAHARGAMISVRWLTQKSRLRQEVLFVKNGYIRRTNILVIIWEVTTGGWIKLLCVENINILLCWRTEY